ncbi:hypothetical protein LEM8419_03354 [Neolewinella maritima]|uniref:Uncharacterized protein n=1 Tax=Neolewinella maritima TaxID=1383882 RepID=A0ABN8F7A8_9BACT|nr:hypothetical protein [Neolewinella maritima]CAH1002475.1 hypothetical protein LEM8419_03354 [Neolewinella maritima]
MRLVMILWCVAWAIPALAQSSVGVADFFLDPVGKPYFLLDDDRLVTANPLGANTYSWYDSSLGSPDYVDVTNPFQILVYYRDYGTVVVLDRTLSELDRLDLFGNPAIEQPGVIARSYDNGIWVFDNWAYRLLRLDDRGQVDQQTNNLRLQLDEPGEPTALFVDRNTVMLYFPDVGRLAVFTNYGQFRRWIELPDAESVSWNAPRLLGTGSTGNWIWQPGQLAVTPLDGLPETLAAERRIRVGPGGYLSAEPSTLGLRLTEFAEKN